MELKQFPKYDVTIPLADYTAKSGTEDTLRPKTWKDVYMTTIRIFVIPERRSLSGTNDPHSKYTWTFTDGKIHNYIVHILTDKRHSSILHVQCFGGADCATDHYRVVAKVRGDIVSKYRRNIQISNAEILS